MHSFWDMAKKAQMAQGASPVQSPVVPIPGGPQNQKDVYNMKFVETLTPTMKTILNSISQMNDLERKKFGYAISQMQIDKNFISKYESMIKRMKGQQ